MVQPGNTWGSPSGRSSAGPTNVMTPSAQATPASWMTTGASSSAPRHGAVPFAVTRDVAMIAPLEVPGMAAIEEDGGCSRNRRRSGTGDHARRLPAVRDPGELGYRDILRIPEIRAAVVGTFVIMMGFGIVSPILPLYARSFGVSLDAVGVLIAAFSVTRLAVDPFTAVIIGRLGERAAVVVGAAVVGATTALAAVAPTFPLLVVFRGAGGAGSAVFFAGLFSFLLRSVPGDRVGRVISVWYASFNVGIIAGQPFGGVLVANGAYAWMIAGVYSTLIPLFGHERVHLSPVGIGIGLAIASVTEFAVLYPAGAATDRIGRRAVIVPSYALLAASLVLFPFASTPVRYMVGLGIFGLITGYSGVPQAAMLSDLTTEDTQRSAVAAFRFVGDLGFVLGPLVAGFSADRLGYGPAFAISALPVVVALALRLSIPETLRALPNTGEAAGL